MSLPDSIQDYDAQAVICKLADIEPVDEDWCEEAKDFFMGHCKFSKTSNIQTLIAQNTS